MSASAITRETFFTLPIEILKNDLSSPHAVKEALALFDQDWLTQQETGTLIEFANRVFAVCASTETAFIPFNMLDQIESIKHLWDDKTRSFHRTLLEKAYEDSPVQFKTIAMGLFRKLLTSCGPCDNLSLEQEHLAILEVALFYKSTKIRDFYLQEPPLETKSPHNFDLFSLSCVWGSVDDFILSLETYERIRGKEALKDYVKDRGWEIGKLLLRNKDDPDAATRIVDIYRSKNLEVSTFLCRNGSGRHTALTYCSAVEHYRYFLNQMTAEEIKMTAEANGYAFLSIFTNMTHPEALDDVLNKLKESGADLSKVHASRNHDSKTILDTFSLDGPPEHLQVLLSHIDSEDKRKLLTTPNYAGRTPLRHSRYYSNSDKPQEELLKQEMRALGLPD